MYGLPLLFWMWSTSSMTLDTYNLGILKPAARISAVIHLPNFLQVNYYIRTASSMMDGAWTQTTMAVSVCVGLSLCSSGPELGSPIP